MGSSLLTTSGNKTFEMAAKHGWVEELLEVMLRFYTL